MCPGETGVGPDSFYPIHADPKAAGGFLHLALETWGRRPPDTNRARQDMRKQTAGQALLVAAVLGSAIVALGGAYAGWRMARRTGRIESRPYQVEQRADQAEEKLASLESDTRMLRLARIVEHSARGEEPDRFQSAVRIRDALYRSVPYRQTPANIEKSRGSSLEDCVLPTVILDRRRASCTPTTTRNRTVWTDGNVKRSRARAG